MADQGSGPQASGEDDEGSSNVEHALLESLFYNEMMMMDDSSASISSDFMAYLSSTSELPQGTPDAGAIAEKDMLRDFGVTSATGSTPAPHDAQTAQSQPQSQHGQPATAVAATRPWPATDQPNPQSNAQKSTKQSAPASAYSAVPANVSESKPESTGQTQLLISQFAVLAGRLGISLPSDVVSSLSHQANSNDTSNGGAPAYQKSLQLLSQLIQSQAQEVSPPDQNEDGAFATDSKSSASEDMSPAVQQLQNNADAAIASVTETRKRTQTEMNSTAGAKPPLYSKRRKKPNLTECESKLASLKAENETLKRHLDTISNKSQKFDQDRKDQEQEMKKLMDEGAGPEKLNPLLTKFSEVYSDYGRHRHQELTFHLQQLQRLIAPTNFTKMGLWTLGQNERFYTDIKRNPIAGILREELGITSQQGRKILEQSQKIRDLSENLKECLRLLGKLKNLCEHKQKVFSDRMSKCQEILTPLQVVKLLLWVDEHSNILESTCPGWGSERIHGKVKKES